MFDPNEAYIAELEATVKAEQEAAFAEEEKKPEEPASVEDKPDAVPSPEAEVEPEPEDEDEADAVSDDEKKRARAFQQRRKRERDLKEELAAERKANQAIAERLARLEGAADATRQKEPEKQAEAEPDRDLYPEDWNAWKITQLEAKLNDMGKFKAEQERVTQFSRELNGVNAIEQQFKEKSPDYEDAAAFLIAKERRIKKIFNPDQTDAQIDAQIQAEKVGFFKELHAKGINPAELVYKLAKEDGWSPKAAAEKKADKPDLSRVADNQRKAASLIGGSSANSGNGAPTSEQILSMSMKDLVKLGADDWDKAIAASMK